MNTRQSILRGGAAMLAVLSLSACVSTPYVRINSVQAVPSSGPPSLPAAIQHAEAVQDLYRDKLIELGEAERNLSTGLIALGGVMLGLGVGHAHHSVIEGAAILGGTANVIGRFTTDKRRAAVYGAGLEAMNCAVGAVSPLNMGSDTLKDVKSWRNDTASGRSDVLKAASHLTGLLTNLPKQDAGTGTAAKAAVAARAVAVKAAGDTLAEVGKAFANSSAAASDGDMLVHRYEQAGGELRLAVKTIDTQVLNTMRALEVDLRAVPDALSRLMDSTRLFSSLATSAADTGPGFAPRSGAQAAGADAATAGLDAATFDLQMKVMAMNVQTERLAKLVKAVSEGIQDNVRDCKAQMPFFTMSVTPSVITFTTGTGTQTVYISGGEGTPTSAFSTTKTFEFTAEFTRQPAPALTLVKEQRKFMVVAGEGVVPGSYPVRVQDSTGGGVQTVTVIVAAAGASGTLDAAAAKAKLDPLKDKEISTAGGKVKLRSFVVTGTKLAVTYSKVVGGGTATNDDVKTELLRTQIPGFNPADLTVGPV